MSNRNNSRRRTTKEALKKKAAPPIGMILIGAGIIIVGIAALFALPGKDSSADAAGGEEYSSVPAPVEYDAPDLTLPNLLGEEESLTDYEGKVVLVNLWATWCPPCKAELPVLQGFYEDYADQDFVIIGIDFGEPEETVAAFVENARLTYPIWVDEGQESGLAFNSYSLPSSFVIDRNGTIVLAWTGQISRSMLEKYVAPVIAGE
jgi:cytochrome c biogenesis protein CcmG/thiol:disulfide interchange protein DsbE